jgi:hypothetical protein
VRNPAELAEALKEGHALVPLLAEFGDAVARVSEMRAVVPLSSDLTIHHASGL